MSEPYACTYLAIAAAVAASAANVATAVVGVTAHIRELSTDRNSADLAAAPIGTASAPMQFCYVQPANIGHMHEFAITRLCTLTCYSIQTRLHVLINLCSRLFRHLFEFDRAPSF